MTRAPDMSVRGDEPQMRCMRRARIHGIALGEAARGTTLPSASKSALSAQQTGQVGARAADQRCWTLHNADTR